MKRRIKAFLMAMVMVFSMIVSTLSGVTVAKADEDLIIKLHYNRPDGNYEDWDVWMWPNGGGDGTGIALNEENGDMVGTYTVPAGAGEIGYIVRFGGSAWSAKDVDMDQFIDVSIYTAGTLHVYVESGVQGHTIDDSQAKQGTKLAYAKYDCETITVKISGNHTDADLDTFKVKGQEGEIAVTERTGSAGTYRLKLAAEMNITKTYTISYVGQTYTITMPDFYSTRDFENKYTYTGNDLGATWTKDATTFRLWAPTAEEVRVKLYQTGTAGANDLIKSVEMKTDVNGTWVATVTGDLNGTYYTYEVLVGGKYVEACDPYARTTGVNGDRAMVIDLDSTDPEGWANDKNPNADLTFNDAIIYELHIRDLSSDSSSGITNVGKYLGLTEHGTTTAGGMATGVDHIKELGITHLHLLPVYDYGSVDESKLDKEQFNWGYDPENYNVPEGSYSTDPYNGEVRVKEFKQMVQSLHNDGISVIMDVVYNHVYNAGQFCFNQIVPQYFSRVSGGVYSQGSGCGNDTASERAMVSKYIVDSVLYWVEEYHIDGFRFDLVGLIDTDTINTIMEEVHKVRPDVVFYGEGWSMSTTVTKPNVQMTTQTNSAAVPGFAFFSDTIRDTLKGSVFDAAGTGFVSGAMGKEMDLMSCYLGLAGSWCKTPAQSINYASCHDNATLWDRLQESRADASKEDLIKMNNLTAAIYMTAEGIPFFQAGEEMLRTKVKPDGTYEHNSYSSPDSINSIKWSTLDNEEYKAVFEYYKGLIAFRKAHPVLRLTNAADVSKYVSTVTGLERNVIGFQFAGGPEGETASAMYIIFNANNTSTSVTLPEGNWDVYVNGEKAGTEVIETISGTATVGAISALVLVQSAPASENPGNEPDTTPGTEVDTETNNDVNTGNDANTNAPSNPIVPIIIGVVIGLAVAGAGIAGFMFLQKKNATPVAEAPVAPVEEAPVAEAAPVEEAAPAEEAVAEETNTEE